jgi:hypothetical protein
MRRKNWPVEDYGIRPAGDPNKCFYCGVERGGVHRKDCVIRNRTIVMKMTVDLVLKVPEHWDIDMCNFHKNESSWCANNILPELERISEHFGCLCGLTKFKYIREATKVDEDSYGVYVKELPT